MVTGTYRVHGLAGGGVADHLLPGSHTHLTGYIRITQAQKVH
ncbi:MAG: hypothetical protein ABSA93_26165 [Streptosporangiaceae bacterium]